MRSGCEDIPNGIADALAADTERLAAANLRMAIEAHELRSDFERAGLALLFVKGLTVGALAYPSPMLKMGRDIDLLIAPEQLADAVELLCNRKYRREIPHPSADLQSWHIRRKESVWARDPAILVELHTRLADNRDLIPGIHVGSHSQEVIVAPGIVLPTLARDELLAHLCVHGASSNWFRLKWITDFAALLHGASEREVARSYARTQELGSFRAADQAFLLADRLYGALRGSALKDQLERGRMSRWLTDRAFAQVAGRVEPREPTAVPLGTWRIHVTQLGLKPGLRFKAGEAFRQVRDALI